MTNSMQIFSVESFIYFVLAQIPEVFVTIYLMLGLSDIRVKPHKIITWGLLIAGYTHVLDVNYPNSSLVKFGVFAIYIIFLRFIVEDKVGWIKSAWVLGKALFIILSTEFCFLIPVLLIIGKSWESLNFWELGVNLTSVIVTVPIRVIEVNIIYFLFRRKKNEGIISKDSKLFKSTRH